MGDFQPKDAHAVHHAMLEARAHAAERREKMPSFAKALETQATDLENVSDKILKRLPAAQRRAYPKTSEPLD